MFPRANISHKFNYMIRKNGIILIKYIIEVKFSILQK